MRLLAALTIVAAIGASWYAAVIIDELWDRIGRK